MTESHKTKLRFGRCLARADFVSTWTLLGCKRNAEFISIEKGGACFATFQNYPEIVAMLTAKGWKAGDTQFYETPPEPKDLPPNQIYLRAEWTESIWRQEPKPAFNDAAIAKNCGF